MGPTILELDLASLPISLPARLVTPTHAQLFMFSAATWNRHHIHYSKDAALAEGHADVVVQRALIGNFLAGMLTDWLGDHGTILALSWKVVSSATPGNTLRCEGEVAAAEMVGAVPAWRCDVRVTHVEGKTIATGNATVRRHVVEQTPAGS